MTKAAPAKRVRSKKADTIEKLNRRALYYVEASKDFRRRIPRMDQLREHLEAWLEKYDRKYVTDPSVGVLYVGVEEKKPFPPEIEVGLSAATAGSGLE